MHWHISHDKHVPWNMWLTHQVTTFFRHEKHLQSILQATAKEKENVNNTNTKSFSYISFWPRALTLLRGSQYRLLLCLWRKENKYLNAQCEKKNVEIPLNHSVTHAELFPINRIRPQWPISCCALPVPLPLVPEMMISTDKPKSNLSRVKTSRCYIVFFF